MSNTIIYTGIFAEPENNAAGKRVFGNSLILESLGYDVLMLGKTQDNHYSGKKKYTNHISFESYPEYGRIKFKGYVDYLEKIIKDQPEKPAYIIRYGAPGLSFYDNEVLQLAHGMGIKVIADVVDWLSADGGNIFFNAIKTFDNYMEKAIYNSNSDGIIAISSYLQNYYKKKVNNIVVVPPIVKDYSKNESVNNNVIIIYAGSPFRPGLKVKDVHKIKDRLDIAVTAFAGIKKLGHDNFIFKIFGLTKDQYLTAFPNHKHIIEEANDSIVFYGRKPMAEIKCELSKADYSILLREVTRATMAGFPTKIVESMSCGTPVITTRTSDLPQYVKDGENGFFVEIEDMEKLKNSIISILNLNKEKLTDIKRNCYRDQMFTPGMFQNSMKDFLQRLV